MTVVMQLTIRETINGGATAQTFVSGSRYQVPDQIGRLWIGRGWARAAAAPQCETSETRATSATAEGADSGASRPSRSSRSKQKE